MICINTDLNHGSQSTLPLHHHSAMLASFIGLRGLCERCSSFENFDLMLILLRIVR